MMQPIKLISWRINAPCYQCQERTEACHCHCDKYLQYRAHIDQRRRENAKKRKRKFAWE